MLKTSCLPEIRAGKSEVSAQIFLKTTLLPDVRAGKSKVHAQNVLEICLLLECRVGTLELLSKIVTSSQMTPIAEKFTTALKASTVDLR